MKFIIDNKIPYIKGALEPFGEVVYLPGAQTTPEVVKDADAIITRTRTNCNEALLAESAVKFIATATIGYDHIDTAYCQQAGIEWTNAPGCNSRSVEQYLTSALLIMAEKQDFQLRNKTIGIVGVGQVGSKVARACKLLGMQVLLNDPPRERAEGSDEFVSLQEIKAQADIITLHVPLAMQGKDATFHLADTLFFSELERAPIVINTCRGEVMDTFAAETAIQRGSISGLVVDCWEREPNIDRNLLALVDLATPHIAGYSKDGKANGTSMSIQAISRFFQLGIDNWQPAKVDLPEQTIIELDGLNRTDEEIIREAVLFTYDVRNDDAALRQSPEQFEQLRGDYPVRREYPVFTVKPKDVSPNALDILAQLGFQIEKSNN